MESPISPSPNFTEIKMKSQPKISIKLPKLLLNPMQKRVAHHHHADHNNNEKHVKKVVTLVFTNPFSKSSSKSNSGKTKPLHCFKNVMRSKSDTTGDRHGVKKQESSGLLVRVLPKPMLSNCRKLKMALSFMRAQKMKTEKFEKVSKQEDCSSEYELCKKRILMGGKCRSGSFRYDQNGILLAKRALVCWFGKNY